MPYLEYEGIWRAILFREHVLSDVLPPLHNNNDNAHKFNFHLFQELNLLFLYYLMVMDTKNKISVKNRYMYAEICLSLERERNLTQWNKIL